MMVIKATQALLLELHTVNLSSLLFFCIFKCSHSNVLFSCLDARHVKQPVHSCVHTLIPAASWQDVASIQQRNHTVSCRFDLICCFRLCPGFPTILRAPHVHTHTSSLFSPWTHEKAGDVILWQVRHSFASLLLEVVSPEQLL